MTSTLDPTGTLPATPYETHEVTNQPPPHAPYDASLDAALLEGLHREGAGWAEPDLRRHGRWAGSPEAQLLAEQADQHEPVLRSVDRYGHRVDEVDFHPAYHDLMRVAVAEGGAGSAWADDRPGAHVARYAGFLVGGHTEAGHGCPISMTYAVVPALRHAPALAAAYEPLLASRVYDPGLRVPTSKRGLLAGMGMTEKQGGSDVRTNTTTATPVGHDELGDTYALRGHKWFTSAPMCDLFLMLAQAPGGLTCFLVPRVLPDGTRNTFRIVRLKDKLGNRSNASSEPELDGTVAWRVGDEGRGVKTIIEMVASTRLDCVVGSAATMRKAFVEAGHHVRHRSAFGSRLLDKPLMRAVLADLAVESEAATTLGLRLAGAADRSARGVRTGADGDERAFRRIGTAVGKYWVTKRAPAFTAEALECLGGNGYVEESGMPRLYREAPLNSVWEGSGNVNALDVLRALGREPGTAEALFAEIAPARGADVRLDAAADRLTTRLGAVLADPAQAEGQARGLVESMALVLQGALLVQHAPAAVADAFCATRLAGDWGHSFGTLPPGVDVDAILERALPEGC